MSGDEWTTVVGVVADAVGIVQWTTDEVARDSRGQVVSVTRHTESRLDPASSYSSHQADEIPIMWRHRAPTGGKVVLLKRAGNLMAVGVLPAPVETFEGLELYWSALTNNDRPFRIQELTITPQPASNGLPPLCFYAGLPDEAKGRQYAPWAMLNRADEVVRAAHGVRYVRCRFDDAAARRRASEPMEYIERPATIIGVNGRPPRGMR